MKVNVKYFASIREAAGCAQQVVYLPDRTVTIEELRLKLSEQCQALATVLADDRPVWFAIDFCQQQRWAPLHDGCEVAFFPPVTGG